LLLYLPLPGLSFADLSPPLPLVDFAPYFPRSFCSHCFFPQSWPFISASAPYPFPPFLGCDLWGVSRTIFPLSVSLRPRQNHAPFFSQDTEDPLSFSLRDHFPLVLLFSPKIRFWWLPFHVHVSIYLFSLRVPFASFFSRRPSRCCTLGSALLGFGVNLFDF